MSEEDEKYICPDCKGDGGRMAEDLYNQYWEKCDNCNGFGYLEEPPK